MIFYARDNFGIKQNGTHVNIANNESSSATKNTLAFLI